MSMRPHEIDEVIGDKKRPAKDIVSDIAKSKVFESLVTRAVEKSEELKPGMMGPSFGQQVRAAIAGDLLHEQVAEPEGS